MKMTREEQNALVHSLLSGADDEEVKVWVVVAHVHRDGKCDGHVHLAGTTGDPIDTVQMLLLGAQMVAGEDELTGPPDVPDSPEGL